MNARILLLSGLFSLSVSSAAAETLRCGNKIVQTGMTMAEVENYCGKPDDSRIEVQDVRAGNRVVGTTELNYWIYNRASGQNAAVLEFDQDKLRTITFLRK